MDLKLLFWLIVINYLVSMRDQTGFKIDSHVISEYHFELYHTFKKNFVTCFTSSNLFLLIILNSYILCILSPHQFTGHCVMVLVVALKQALLRFLFQSLVEWWWN